MTDEPFAPGGVGERESDSTGAFVRAMAHIRGDPFLLVPFALAGLVLSLVDWLRIRDPVPTVVTERLRETAIHLEFSIFLTGTPGTMRRIAALVDLETQYLVWAIGLELVAVLAVSVAGWYTIARTAAVDATTAGLRSYVGFVVLLAAAFVRWDRSARSARWVPSGSSSPLGYCLASCSSLRGCSSRPHSPPSARHALGTSPWTAIRGSVGLSSGHTYPLAKLVVLYGILAWLLGTVPYAGALVSSLGVAVVHAVSTVTVLESVTDREFLE